MEGCSIPCKWCQVTVLMLSRDRWLKTWEPFRVTKYYTTTNWTEVLRHAWRVSWRWLQFRSDKNLAAEALAVQGSGDNDAPQLVQLWVLCVETACWVECRCMQWDLTPWAVHRLSIHSEARTLREFSSIESVGTGVVPYPSLKQNKLKKVSPNKMWYASGVRRWSHPTEGRCGRVWTARFSSQLCWWRAWDSTADASYLWKITEK